MPWRSISVNTTLVSSFYLFFCDICLREQYQHLSTERRVTVSLSLRTRLVHASIPFDKANISASLLRLMWLDYSRERSDLISRLIGYHVFSSFIFFLPACNLRYLLRMPYWTYYISVEAIILFLKIHRFRKFVCYKRNMLKNIINIINIVMIWKIRKFFFQHFILKLLITYNLFKFYYSNELNNEIYVLLICLCYYLVCLTFIFYERQ